MCKGFGEITFASRIARRDFYLKTFKSAVRNREFAVSAEIFLRPETDAEALRVQTDVLRDSVDGILLTDRQFSDFVVKAKFRVHSGDSGFYFRAERVKSAVSVHGFQVEVDTSQETGGLYETGGRAWVHRPTAEVIKKRGYERGEWTDLELSAIGRNIIVKINGVVSTELKNDKGRLKGYIGLQLHGGQVMHVEYKDIAILEK